MTYNQARVVQELRHARLGFNNAIACICFFCGAVFKVLYELNFAIAEWLIEEDE